VRRQFKAQTVATIARLNKDTGANRSGTSDKSILKNVTKCDSITISGAFGPGITPSLKGELGPLKLDTVVIDGMGPQTIISVSQVCQLGQGHIVLFTPNNFCVYTLEMRVTMLLTHDGKDTGLHLNGRGRQTLVVI
jgi:hypothetical protein